MGTDKVITAKICQAEPASNLTLSGTVVVDSTLIAPSGAILGNTTFNGTVPNLTKAMAGLSNVDNITGASKPVSTDTRAAQGKKEDMLSAQLLLKRANNVNRIKCFRNRNTFNRWFNQLVLYVSLYLRHHS